MRIHEKMETLSALSKRREPAMDAVFVFPGGETVTMSEVTEETWSSIIGGWEYLEGTSIGDRRILVGTRRRGEETTKCK